MNLCLAKKTEFSLLYPRWAGSVDLSMQCFLDQIFGQEFRGQNVDHVVSRRSIGWPTMHNVPYAAFSRRSIGRAAYRATSLGIFTPTTICSHDPFTFTHCNHEQNIGRWSRMMIPSQRSDGLWGLSPVLVSVLVRLAIRPFWAVSII